MHQLTTLLLFLLIIGCSLANSDVATGRDSRHTAKERNLLLKVEKLPAPVKTGEKVLKKWKKQIEQKQQQLHVKNPLVKGNFFKKWPTLKQQSQPIPPLNLKQIPGIRIDKKCFQMKCVNDYCVRRYICDKTTTTSPTEVDSQKTTTVLVGENSTVTDWDFPEETTNPPEHVTEATTTTSARPPSESGSLKTTKNEKTKPTPRQTPANDEKPTTKTPATGVNGAMKNNSIDIDCNKQTSTTTTKPEQPHQQSPKPTRKLIKTTKPRKTKPKIPTTTQKPCKDETTTTTRPGETTTTTTTTTTTISPTTTTATTKTDKQGLSTKTTPKPPNCDDQLVTTKQTVITSKGQKVNRWTPCIGKGCPPPTLFKDFKGVGKAILVRNNKNN